MTGLVPESHRRLLRRSRWRIAVFGAFILTLGLTLLSAGAYAVVQKRMYIHLEETLVRAAHRARESGAPAGPVLLVDERGRWLGGLSPAEWTVEGRPGMRIVEDPVLGPLALLELGSAGGEPQAVATLAQREIRSANDFLRVLIAMTLVGGVIGLPIGYALAGLALRPISEAVRERSEFVALASHQLRTPLSVIRTSAELAKTGKGVSPDEALATILGQAERMETLAARLTALARAETKVEEGHGQGDLVDTAETVVAALAPAAAQAGVTLDVDAPRPVGTRLGTDELTDLLTPLVENAIRFSPRRGNVTVRVLPDGGNAIAEVADQGPGIAPEDLPHVSRPFFQGRRARGGFGLGLAIAQAIVDRHRGRLSIVSTPGHGTTVRVILPGLPQSASSTLTNSHKP